MDPLERTVRPVSELCLYTSELHPRPDPKKLAKADIVITSYNVLASEHGVHTTSASNHSTSKKKKNDSSNSEEDEDSNSDSDDAFSKKMGKALLKKAPKAKTAKKGKKTQAALFGLIWWRVVLGKSIFFHLD
jgi:hypothetical protein